MMKEPYREGVGIRIVVVPDVQEKCKRKMSVKVKKESLIKKKMY